MILTFPVINNVFLGIAMSILIVIIAIRFIRWILDILP